MKARLSRNHCPVCRQPCTPDTPTRKVQMFRELVDDEGVAVMAAKCTKCGTEYEFYGPQKVPINMGGPRLLAMVLITLLLSVLSGIVGVILATEGANELNPILSFYLSYSPVYFFFVKFFLTASGILLLVLSKKRFEHLRELDTEQILFGVQVVFALILIYDLIAFGTGGKMLLLAMAMWMASVYYLKPSGFEPIMNGLSSASSTIVKKIRLKIWMMR